MMHVIGRILQILGLIFLVLLIYAAYVFFNSSQQVDLSTGGGGGSEQTTDVVDKNPYLSSGQEQVLETIGIDPASLPTSITPEQEACAVSILGEARVNEIKAGATPTVIEAYRVKECL